MLRHANAGAAQGALLIPQRRQLRKIPTSLPPVFLPLPGADSPALRGSARCCRALFGVVCVQSEVGAGARHGTGRCLPWGSSDELGAQPALCSEVIHADTRQSSSSESLLKVGGRRRGARKLVLDSLFTKS